MGIVRWARRRHDVLHQGQPPLLGVSDAVEELKERVDGTPRRGSRLAVSEITLRHR